MQPKEGKLGNWDSNSTETPWTATLEKNKFGYYPEKMFLKVTEKTRKHGASVISLQAECNRFQ